MFIQSIIHMYGTLYNVRYLKFVNKVKFACFAFSSLCPTSNLICLLMSKNFQLKLNLFNTKMASLRSECPCYRGGCIMEEQITVELL